VLFLGACGHTPVTRTLFEAIPGLGQNVDAIKLNPNLRYLRVTVRGRVAFMVLGYVEPYPEGNIDTWYSSEGEVLRLQNGRIVGTAGLETDWRAVRPVALPAWKDMAARAGVGYNQDRVGRAAVVENQDMVGRAAVLYSRERDEMPGYRYGIAERLRLYPVPVPYNSKLVGLSPTSLRWFEEEVIGQPDGLASGRYALHTKEDGEPLVAYGEQCLSRTLCIAWQLWAATP